MSDDDKPIHQMDRLVLRVPDGFKERLEQRARAHGRSMNAEAVVILSEAIKAPDVLGLRALQEERQRLKAQMSEARRALETIEDRAKAVNREIMEREDRARRSGYRSSD